MQTKAENGEGGGTDADGNNVQTVFADGQLTVALTKAAAGD